MCLLNLPGKNLSFDYYPKAVYFECTLDQVGNKFSSSIRKAKEDI